MADRLCAARPRRPHLKACSCSQLLASQMRTVASLLLLMTWLPSAE
jgi:hypothetical protein